MPSLYYLRKRRNQLRKTDAPAAPAAAPSPRQTDELDDKEMTKQHERNELRPSPKHASSTCKLPCLSGPTNVAMTAWRQGSVMFCSAPNVSAGYSIHPRKQRPDTATAQACGRTRCEVTRGWGFGSMRIRNQDVSGTKEGRG